MESATIEQPATALKALPLQPETKPVRVEDVAPWVRYRVEYRDVSTDDLISRRDARDPADSLDSHPGIDEPVFELVTVYKSRKSAGTNGNTVASSVLALSHTKHLNLYSPSIVNALQSVIKYYPSQDLSGNPVVVQYPYAALVHHYDELQAFRQTVATKGLDEMCDREVHASNHLALLLKFLDDNIMEDVRLEKERNKNGTRTWEFMWVGYKPGLTRMDRFIGHKDWTSSVVHSVTGGIFDNPPTSWNVKTWSMDFDGNDVGRNMDSFFQLKFDGEQAMRDEITLSTAEFLEAAESNSLPQEFITQIEYGKIWWKLLKKQCRHYKGKSQAYPHNEVDGLVMVDTGSSEAPRAALMGTDDCRTSVSDCLCPLCSDGRNGERKVLALFESYNTISPEEYEELTDHQYLLCPTSISAFVFKTREWEPLHVRGFSEPNFQEDMIHGLVMDDRRKETLKALAKSFARRNKFGEKLDQSMWSADFVRGKGSGLIFLLHGVPGVGKTCTAECISAFTRRPLMVLTPSDIGTTPSDVETNLTTMFKRARRWDAVLLIDEADVFMERRTAADLLRNSLVAGFLRALENFDGILFLTTNRVGAFDDAFRSRVHVQLYYPEFTEDQRQQVWKTFIDKLAKERGDRIRLNIDAKEYIRGAEVRALEWNGRDIRNAFQTAVALAEYDAEKDDDGKILVTDTHLRAVAEFSRDFKDYLQTLHKGNEATRAQRKFERYDGFSSAPSKS